MNKQILVVNDTMNIAGLHNEPAGDLLITSAATGKDGLAALAISSDWCVVLAAAQLSDMNGLTFLQEAAALSGAIPLLLVADTDLGTAVHQANSHSFFRVIPESTPAEILKVILLDAARQFRLINQEKQLRERIKQLTVMDSLTGCYTRLHQQEHFAKELRRSIRYGHPVSIILCDIDALKEVNAAFGHRVGDQLLTGFAQTAMQLTRQDIDTITRWGEDEFLLILPETHIRGAGRVASRLREQFELLEYEASGHRVAATASFGVAGFTPELPERNTAPEDLLLIAERCLAQAKVSGGNQVLCCP